jgi:(p)ppGpp synthase/HD superfamily hydrolase
MEYSGKVKELNSSFKEIEEIAYLHDTLEDTEASEKEIYELFGWGVWKRVLLLTDKPGKNRRERHRNTYPLIAEDPVATFVKLMDRLANVQSGKLNPEKLSMYKKEQKYFKETLRTDSRFDLVWKEIEKELK